MFERYYGGRTLDNVAGTVAALKARGIRSTVSLLPKFRLRPAGVDAEKRKILEILPSLKGRGLDADLTVKLSQLGQRWAPADCRHALKEIAAQAAALGAFVWVDMEQSTLVDRTLDEFLAVRADHPNLGLCLQSCLRRTPRDLDRLLKDGHPVRLVKGYYRERPPDCFDTWAEATDCFRRLIEPLVHQSSRPAIGTHDGSLLAEARRVLSLHPRRDFEFQFFLGARPELAEAAVRDGFNARMYIPYGPLLPYFLHTLPYMDFSRNVQRLLGFKTIR